MLWVKDEFTLQPLNQKLNPTHRRLSKQIDQENTCFCTFHPSTSN